MQAISVAGPSTAVVAAATATFAGSGAAHENTLEKNKQRKERQCVKLHTHLLNG